jgi:alkylation response protein AidB-like acyl-CoA dehydrogenase
MTRIASADDALEVAAKLAAEFDAEAAARDADRRLPDDQVDALKRSGLLAVTIWSRLVDLFDHTSRLGVRWPIWWPPTGWR